MNDRDAKNGAEPGGKQPEVGLHSISAQAHGTSGGVGGWVVGTSLVLVSANEGCAPFVVIRSRADLSFVAAYVVNLGIQRSACFDPPHLKVGLKMMVFTSTCHMSACITEPSGRLMWPLAYSMTSARALG